MKQEPVLRDERYYVVENASYKIGYILLAASIMLWVMYRSIVYQESNWIVFGLVWVSSVAVTIYQLKQKILHFDKRVLFFMMLVTLIAAAVPFILKAVW